VFESSARAAPTVERFRHVAVGAEHGQAALRPAGFAQEAVKVGAAGTIRPLRGTIVVNVIELQKIKVFLAAALADFAVGVDRLTLQSSIRKGSRFAAYLANSSADFGNPAARAASAAWVK